MSAPLKDVRSAIDECTDMLLDAHASARGITKAEVIRDVLRAWGDEQLKIHRKIGRDLKRAGFDAHGEPTENAR